MSSIPVFDVEFFAREQVVPNLQNPDAYEGLIITSQRAVSALQRFLPMFSPLHEMWRTKPVYVVGPATKKSAEEMGFETRGERSLNARNLAALVAEKQGNRALLFLCGEQRRDELPEALRAYGIPFFECIVYRTIPRNPLALSDWEKPDWVVCYSPRGAQIVVKAWPAHWNTVSVGCIGETTAHEMQQLGHDVSAIASVPTPEGVWVAVSSNIRFQQRP